MLEPIRLFSMFSGYGGAEFALKKAGIKFECVGYSEVDKYAIQCYEQNHGYIEAPFKTTMKNLERDINKEKKPKNYGDCTKIIPEELPDFDLLCAGPPCQDASIAGKRDLSKGRTLLINDVFRIAKVKKPKYIVIENVKGFISVADGRLFDYTINTLKKLGYGVAYKVLNSKHYGIPQNRERIWIVCKYGGWEFMEFQFPHKEKLKLTIKDILEEKVDKKYYLSEKQVKSLTEGLQESKLNPEIAASLQCPGHSWGNYKGMNLIGDYRIDEGLRIRKDNCSPTIKAKSGGGLTPDILVHSLFPRSGNPEQGGTGHLSKSDGTSYCIDTGNCQAIELPAIVDLYNHKIKTDGTCITLTEPHHNNLRVIVPEVHNCITEPIGRQGSSSEYIDSCKRIHKIIGRWRRLTPKECFRLQGFLNDEINLDNLSDTQKYRLAGNGWEISVASKIMKNLLK